MVIPASLSVSADVLSFQEPLADLGFDIGPPALLLRFPEVKPIVFLIPVALLSDSSVRWIWPLETFSVGSISATWVLISASCVVRNRWLSHVDFRCLAGARP